MNYCACKEEEKVMNAYETEIKGMSDEYLTVCKFRKDVVYERENPGKVSLDTFSSPNPQIAETARKLLFFCTGNFFFFYLFDLGIPPGLQRRLLIPLTDIDKCRCNLNIHISNIFFRGVK